MFRGVVSYSSELPVAIVFCIFLGFFFQVPLRRSYLTYQTTGRHDPEAISSTVTNDGVPQKGDKFLDMVNDHQLLKGTANKTTYV